MSKGAQVHAATEGAAHPVGNVTEGGKKRRAGGLERADFGWVRGGIRACILPDDRERFGWWGMVFK